MTGTSMTQTLRWMAKHLAEVVGGAAAAAAVLTAAMAAEPTAAAVPPGQISTPPATSKLPIIMKWTPVVGDLGGLVPIEQAANERLTRHLLLERVLDDGRSFVIRWQVLPDGPYPAKPELFRDTEYPSGVIHMGKGQRTADVAIQTYETGKPDWKREFKVVLTDAETGNPILSPYMTPIQITFMVFGDLNCAPGRPDLCDDDPDEAFQGNPFGAGKKGDAQDDDHPK